ncbi:hypothetical protein AGMMS49992_12390 [Clostridia bacterium]|nr:hypothetical protein AGMMS49992_12390 [Clostridia bacterium]
MLEEGNIDRNINSGKIVSEQGDAGGIIAYVGMYQLNFTLNDNVVTESCTITGEHSCAGIAASLNLTDNGGVVEVKNNWACCASIKCTGDPNYGVAGYRIYNHDYPWYMSFNPVSNNRANENMRLTVISNDPDDSYNNEKVTPSSPYYGADDRQGESTDECPVYCVTIKYSGSTAQLGKPPQPVKARLGATYYPSGSPGTLRRAGYVLCGWSAVPGGPALSSFTARDNATLYPVWKRNMFFDIMNCGGCGCVDIYSDEYRCKKVKGD